MFLLYLLIYVPTLTSSSFRFRAGDFVIGEKGRQVGAMIWEEMKSIWMKEGIVVC